MRIIGGKYRSRLIERCNIKDTRETQDRVREAIFNSLGDINNKFVLDLFCGSSSMAIEAISRGAKMCVINDINKECIKISNSNFNRLNITNYKYYNLDYKEFLKEYRFSFDIIFIDPPYIMNNTKDILLDIYSSNVSKSDTLVVFESNIKTDIYSDEYIVFLKEKYYGKKKVMYYKIKKGV